MSNATITVGLQGICGRMGQKIAQRVLADPEMTIGLAVDRAGHPAVGSDVGAVVGLASIGTIVTDHFPARARLDAMIAFSTPEATLEAAGFCAARQIPLLVGTTGFSTTQREELLAYHHETALLVAANCSLVVNVLMKLIALAGRVLKDKDFDVEIVERHHRHKADSPSGTALRLAEIVEANMGLTSRRYGREGLVGERPRNELGLHAIRTGDNVGEHTVIFGTVGESLELVHRGTSRDSYVAGAVLAARFLVGKKPGLYDMADVLGLAQGEA